MKETNQTPNKYIMELIIKEIIFPKYLRIKNSIWEETHRSIMKWPILNLSHQVEAKEVQFCPRVTSILKWVFSFTVTRKFKLKIQQNPGQLKEIEINKYRTNYWICKQLTLSTVQAIFNQHKQALYLVQSSKLA
jgi:hypothetical protein